MMINNNAIHVDIWKMYGYYHINIQLWPIGTTDLHAKMLNHVSFLSTGSIIRRATCMSEYEQKQKLLLGAQICSALLGIFHEE